MGAEAVSVRVTVLQVEESFGLCCTELRDSMSTIMADYKGSIESQAKAQLAQHAARYASAWQ